MKDWSFSLAPGRGDYSESPIEIHPDSIAPSRGLLAIPSVNPQSGLTLEVIGAPSIGLFLRLTDPIGSVVWTATLVGVAGTPVQ